MIRKTVESRKYENYYFPPLLHSLGLLYMGPNEMQILFPYAARLKKLDLQFTFLSTEDHCQIVQHCPNLEVLEVCWKIILCVYLSYCDLVNFFSNTQESCVSLY
jgi:hypothetical protein